MDGFELCQGLLREALGIAALGTTPGVAVGVKRHALNLQTIAALLKLGGAVARPNGAEV